jgi:hypothetical protein
MHHVPGILQFYVMFWLYCGLRESEFYTGKQTQFIASLPDNHFAGGLMPEKF